MSQLVEVDFLDEKLINVVKEMFPDYRLLTNYSNKEIVLYKNKIPYLTIMKGKYKEEVYKKMNEYTVSDTKVILCINSLEENELKQLLQMNLDGYFYYQMSQAEIKDAMNIILRDKRYIHYKFTSTLIKDYVRLMNDKRKKLNELLSSRESEILELVVKGYTVNRIAEMLEISSSTVNNHMAKILQKLRVPDKTNAVLVAIKKNWFIL